jgi:large conductance mechanosensitive channel protein
VKDFKAFLLRGNLVDMAVGIVIGVAFTAVVTALVGDLITPLIGATRILQGSRSQFIRAISSTARS